MREIDNDGHGPAGALTATRAVAAPRTAEPALVAGRNLSAGYHGRAVIRGVDIEVFAGEIVALLGANGAGKTTTLITLAGKLTPMAGEVLVDGTPSTLPLYKRARRGLAYVSEERSTFMPLTVMENLKVSGCDMDTAFSLFPELLPLRKQKAGTLSGGEQQILTLARALARRPRCLLADEISLGLAPLLVDRLLAVVRNAADMQRMGVILVEQQIRKAVAVADRVCVMQSGEIVLSGTSQQLDTRLDEIEALYLGG